MSLLFDFVCVIYIHFKFVREILLVLFFVLLISWHAIVVHDGLLRFQNILTFDLDFFFFVFTPCLVNHKKYIICIVMCIFFSLRDWTHLHKQGFVKFHQIFFLLMQRHPRMCSNWSPLYRHVEKDAGSQKQNSIVLFFPPHKKSFLQQDFCVHSNSIYV